MKDHEHSISPHIKIIKYVGLSNILEYVSKYFEMKKFYFILINVFDFTQNRLMKLFEKVNSLRDNLLEGNYLRNTFHEGNLLNKIKIFGRKTNLLRDNRFKCSSYCTPQPTSTVTFHFLKQAIVQSVFFFLLIGIIESKHITELQYFLNQTINISNSAHQPIHLSYSEQEKAFIFANSNVSPLMFNYRDDAVISCVGDDKSCTSYKITVGDKEMCAKDGNVDICSGDEQSEWHIDKKQFGFTISAPSDENKRKKKRNTDAMCLTKEESLKAQLSKCSGDPSQLFDFSISIVCTDPSRDLRNRTADLTRLSSNPATLPIETIIRNIMNQMGILNSGGILQNAWPNSSISTIPVKGISAINPLEQLVYPHYGQPEVILPRYDQLSMYDGVYDHTLDHRPIYDSGSHHHDGLEKPVTVVREPRVIDDDGRPRSYSYIADETPHLTKKFVHTDPLHQRIKKVKPATTSVETKTVPVKMRVETREEPTIISVDRRMVEEVESAEKEVEDTDEKEEEEQEEDNE